MAKVKVALGSVARRGPASDGRSHERFRAEPAVEDQRSVVNSLAKGFGVLEAFTSERLEMTLSEVAREASLDPGTAFRMLNTLVMLGYVTRVSDTKRFRLSLKVVDLGLNAIARADLREVARPVLRSLVGETTEAASLGVLDGADILYVERVRAGVMRLGVDIRIGTHVPACGSVIGYAMLAHLPAIERDRVLAMTPRAGGHDPMRMSKSALGKLFGEIRKQGYALQDSPFGNGLQVLAAPVLDIDGYPVASVSVAAPPTRASADAFRARALEPLRAAARDISRAVQASGTISTAV